MGNNRVARSSQNTRDEGQVTDIPIDLTVALTYEPPTGTPDGTKFLRDDNSWQSVAGGSGLTEAQVRARVFLRC